jgi:hypoxanthine phosphoribosyltransferase
LRAVKLDYLRVSWSDVEKDCKKISDQVDGGGFSDYLLIGISRGGLVPLRIISDLINSVELLTLGVKFYEDLGITVDKPKIIFPVPEEFVTGENILLIDDISDTGESLIAAKKHLSNLGALDIVTATLLKKPHTRLTPDYYAQETDSWVIFPWEINETLKKIIGKADNSETAEDELRRAFITKKEYEKELEIKFGGQ